MPRVVQPPAFLRGSGMHALVRRFFIVAEQPSEGMLAEFDEAWRDAIDEKPALVYPESTHLITLRRALRAYARTALLSTENRDALEAFLQTEVVA